VDPRRPKWWRPAYSGTRLVHHGGGKRPDREPFSWVIVGVAESECPVSLITERSFELVQIVNAMQNAFETTGSAVGADEMPGCLFDAVRLCAAEARTCDAAQEEAADR
jgi:hypothetical protein